MHDGDLQDLFPTGVKILPPGIWDDSHLTAKAILSAGLGFGLTVLLYSLYRAVR